jgi:cytochrome P450
VGRPPAPYTLIPFGGGAHRCIGASFAVMEMKAVMRTIFEGLELQPSFSKPERPVRGRRIVTYPARGARITVTER